MSVATESAPLVGIPARARLRADQHAPWRRGPQYFGWAADLAPSVEESDGCRYPERRATVTVLRRPSARAVAAPVRLTRRGVVVLGVAVAVLASAMIGVAWLSAPGSASGSVSAPATATVTVRSGDSLWSIAQRIAPAVDPRAEVATLQQVNHIGGSALLPGQVLRTG